MNLFRSAGIYAFFTVLQRAIGFFLLPIYTHYLTPADYGIVGMVNSVVPVLAILFALSVRGAVTRKYYQYKDTDPLRVRRIWGASLALVLVNGGLLSVLIILVNLIFAFEVFQGIPFFPYLLLGVITAMLNAVFMLYQASLQAKQEAGRFGRQNLAFFLVNLSLSLAMVVGFDMGAMGVLLGLCITNGIFFVYTLKYFLKDVDLNLSHSEVKEVLSYSLPLVPHQISGWAVSLLDRWFVNHFVGTAAVGLYNVGFQFGNIVNMMAVAMNQAWTPWFYGEFEKGNKKQIRKAAVAVISLYCTVAMSISLASPLLISFMTEKSYHEAWTIVPVLAFTYVFAGLYFIAVGPIFLEKTRLVPLISFSTAALSILLNWQLASRFGMIGSATASLFSWAFMAFLSMLFTIKHTKMDYPWITLFGLPVFTFFLTVQVQENDSFLVQATALTAFASVVLGIQKKQLLEILKNLKKRKS